MRDTTGDKSGSILFAASTSTTPEMYCERVLLENTTGLRFWLVQWKILPFYLPRNERTGRETEKQGNGTRNEETRNLMTRNSSRGKGGEEKTKKNVPF